MKFVFIFTVHILAFFLIWKHGLIFDEHYHYNQIQRFLHFDFRIDPELPMTPGYHAVIAGAGRMAGLHNLGYYPAYPWVRLVSFVFSLLTIGVFYAIAVHLDEKTAFLRTIQYGFFPLVFPFFPLLYTDLFSLLMILCSFLFLLKKKYFFSASIAALSILIRQNNVFFAVFFFAILYVQHYGLRLSTKQLVMHGKRFWMFVVLPLLVVGLFFVVNRQLSVGRQTHVFFTLSHPSNIYLVLVLLSIFFLPVILSRIDKIRKFCRKHAVFLLIPILFFPLYVVSFTNTHPFNQGTFFWHNWFAVYFTISILHKLAFYICMVIGILSLFVVRLLRKEFYLLYPLTLVFLLPLWFIEQRYYIVPFTLFLLFRKPEKKLIEYILTCWFILLSLYLYEGVLHWKFFL